MATRSKIVLLGSAPYSPEWVRSHSDLLEDRNVQVVAINNAWAIAPERVDGWFFSDDYFVTAAIPPKTGEDFSRLRCQRIGFHSGWVKTPLWYSLPVGNSGTMILNSLYTLANMQLLGVLEKQPTYCIGTDLHYCDRQSNHFYGAGTNDPLRYGEEWINGELQRASEAFASIGLEFYVGHECYPTRLRFERRKL